LLGKNDSQTEAHHKEGVGMCKTVNDTGKGRSTDITGRFDKLGIIAFDGAGTAVKEDVVTALDAIELTMQSESDEKMYNHIKELQDKKKERRNAFLGAK
jgi:hypothetical protein